MLRSISSSIYFVFVIFISLSGCTISDSAQLSVTPTILPPAPTSTPFPVLEADNTISVSPPAPSLEPSLTVEQRDQLVRILLSTNQNCQLPCVWGIVPGKTKWSEVHSFFDKNHLGLSKDGYPYPSGTTYNAAMDLQNPFMPTRLSFYEEAGIVRLITLGVAKYKDDMDQPYAIKSVLNTFGKPSSILIEMTGSGVIRSEDLVPYKISIFYKDKIWMLGIYQGKARVAEDQYSLCPFQPNENQDDLFFSIIVQDAKKPLSLEQITEYLGGGEPVLTGMDIEMALNTTITEFYEKFKTDDTSVCFQTLRKLWEH